MGFQILRGDIHDYVAVDLVAELVNGKAAVCVAVEGKADIEIVLTYKLL